MPDGNNITPRNSNIIHNRDTQPIDLYFIKLLNQVTLASSVSVEDTEIVLSDATGFVDGDYIGVFNFDTKRFYFGTQIGAPVGNTIALDTPIDSNFLAGSNVIRTTRDMNVNGSVTPQIFLVRGGCVGCDFEMDIVGINIQIMVSNPPEYSDFGNISNGLTKGIVLRRNNGLLYNIFNIKNNSEMKNVIPDFHALEINTNNGVEGIFARYKLAGQNDHGTAVRLKPNDFLEVVIQDDLRPLSSFRMMTQGHITL